jgi:hypothetical protein
VISPTCHKIKGGAQWDYMQALIFMQGIVTSQW